MLKDLFKSKAQKQAELDLENAQSKLQSFNSNIKVSSARKLLRHANIALRAKDWETVSRLSDLCIKKIEEIGQVYKHAREVRDSAKSILLSAKKKDVDISNAEELFEKAESTFESGEYNVAEELYNSVKELVEQIIKETEKPKETEKLKE
ncbi:MAG: hypothetical protein ACE5KE_15960, partial [Methanosarcinales archaeon]